MASYEKIIHALSSSRRNDRFCYRKRLKRSSYAKVRAKTVCCISLLRKFRAKPPGRFRAKPKVCTRCSPKTGILTLFADLRGRFRHQDDLGWKSDQLKSFSPLQDLQLCFWDHRHPKYYAAFRFSARGLLDIISARKFRTRPEVPALVVRVRVTFDDLDVIWVLFLYGKSTCLIYM